MSRSAPRLPELAEVSTEVSPRWRRWLATMTHINAIYRLIPRPLKVLVWMGLVALGQLLDLPLEWSDLVRAIQG